MSHIKKLNGLHTPGKTIGIKSDNADNNNTGLKRYRKL